LGAEPFPDPTQRRLTRLDQQLACLSADGEPQKVEALVEGDDARLVLVEGQTPGRQPLSEPRLDLFRFVPGVAQSDQIIGIPNQNRRTLHRVTGMNTGLSVPDPGGLFHPMQSNIQEQRTDDSSNAMANLVRGPRRRHRLWSPWWRWLLCCGWGWSGG